MTTRKPDAAGGYIGEALNEQPPKPRDKAEMIARKFCLDKRAQSAIRRDIAAEKAAVAAKRFKKNCQGDDITLQRAGYRAGYEAGYRRAIAAERRKERERCLKILRLAAADARELGDRSDHFGQAERAILGERQ